MMIRRRAVLLLALGAVQCGWARARAQDAGAPADVGASLAPILKKHDVPAMAVLVLHGREVVARGVSGVRKAGDSTPATIDDQWHLGSCTKSMTATMIASLVKEGSLSWGTTLGEVFGDLDGTMDPAWKDVTLELLLEHRAGVPGDLSKDGLWGRLWQRKGTPTEQRLQLVRGVLKNPPVHKPGTDFEYANAGFAIAGAMAEKVTGKSWEDLMQERVFGPLGMKSAGFGAPGTPGNVDQPWGHGQNGKPESPGPFADNPAAIGPGGSVHCTIGDWGKYVALHLGGEQSGDGETKRQGDGESGPAVTVLDLSAADFVKLHTPFKGPGSEYAMGWGVATRPWARGAAKGDTGRVLTHNGTNTMWFAVVWLAPEKDWAVLACCNKGGDEAGKATDEAVWEMAKRYVRSEP